jgi:hypothetical protein
VEIPLEIFLEHPQLQQLVDYSVPKEAEGYSPNSLGLAKVYLQRLLRVRRITKEGKMKKMMMIKEKQGTRPATALLLLRLVKKALKIN